MRYFSIFGCVVGAALLMANPVLAQAQRVLGVDVSYWNRGSSSPSSNGISQSAWNTGFSDAGGARKFAQIRASRGGTTGVNPTSGTPGSPATPATLSERYDDPDFTRNITRAANAGMIAGGYHFARPDVAGNTGTDEANHFLEAAGAWMRPGYLMPMYDMEAGQSLGGNALAQHAIDFSNRLYNVMGIRPSMYINGSYSGTLQSASASLRNRLAQPSANSPSMVGPAFPVLWNARYSANGSSADNYAIPVQTGSPKTTYTTISSYYGPWDDYGNSAPWGMWQYGSVQSIPGFNTVDATVDGNVSHGDSEYVKDMMVPAVWWHNSSGDWATMANWNSGQTIGSHAAGDPFPTAPYTAAGQYPAVSGGVLPVPRLPGTAGSGPAITSGVNDTVILERQSANITVTVSTGSFNVRKLYMREALNITGGSLTINYDPTYRPNNDANVLHSGPLSAQFSGAVTLSGGSLSAHTLQVDSTRTFTIGGGNLSFNKINLMPHVSTSAQILLNGDMNITPLANATATIANGAGGGNAGRFDLGGASRRIDVANGGAAVDLAISVPIINGGLTKAGAGTLALSGVNTYAGDTSVEAGVLRLAGANLANAADMYLATGSLLDLTFSAGTPDVVDSLFVDGVSQQAGVWGAVGSGAEFTSPLITGTGRLQVTTFIAPPAPIPGDFDGNGTVETADLTAWQNGFGMAGDANAANGDADEDGDVDGGDFLVWQRNLGQTQSTAVAATVPEPGAAVLMLLAMGGLLGRRGRRSPLWGRPVDC